MDNNKIADIAIGTCAVGAIAIIVGAVVLYEKSQFSTDGLTYSAIVIVILYCFVVAVGKVFDGIADLIGGPAGSAGTGYSHDVRQADNSDNSSLEFIRPVGMIPVMYDPENRFTDIYGNEYRKLHGYWYDYNGNFCPDYLKDMYGLSYYEDSHKDD